MAAQAVAAGASDLLVVRLEGAGNVEMGDEPDVRLVDAHSERVGGDDDARLPTHEAFLHRRPLGVGHAGVVAHGVDIRGAQDAHHLLDVLAGGGVDDAGPARPRQRDETAQLVLVAGHAQHLDEEVGPVEPGHEYPRIAQLECVGDVAAHFRRRGGGQGEDAFRANLLACPGELLVLRPEVVSPGGDAVRLVDREERDREVGHGREEGRGLEPFRSHVHEAVFAPAQRALTVLPFALRQRAVHERGRDSACAQRIDLVFHQGDERRDHHGGALEQQRRKLIAEALAAARRQDGDGGPAGEHRPDDGLLSLAKGVVPEMLLQGVEQLHLHSPYPTPSRGTSETASGGPHAPSTALCNPASASTR